MERAPSCLPVLLWLIYRPRVGIWQALTVSGWFWGKEGAFVTKSVIEDYWELGCQSALWKTVILQNAQVEMHSVLTAMFGEALALAVCYSTAPFVKWFTCLKGSCREVRVCRSLEAHRWFLRLQADKECYFQRKSRKWLHTQSISTCNNVQGFLQNTKLCLTARHPAEGKEGIQLLRGK